MVKKILTGVILTVLIIFLASVSYASEAEVLLRMLLKKGIITQAEYDEVKEELKGSEEGQKQWKVHVDKHITHAEEAGPALTDGLSIAGGITMVGQGTSGNDDNVPPGEDVIDGTISTDLELSASVGEHGEAFMLVEAGAGDGLQDNEIVTYWGVNDDAGDNESHLEVTEAWYEHMFFNDMVTVTVGKLDMSVYFDGNEVANDETTQFLASGFVNSIAIEFPDNSAATRLTVSPNEFIDISVGMQSGDSDWEDILEKPFLMAEADVKPKFGELRGNYRVYVWTNRTNHTELKDTTNDKEHASGYGISLDQQAADYLTLFARVGYQDKKIYEYDIAWSGGLALSGSLWGRNDDVLGIAYGEARLSDDYEDFLKAAGTKTANEGHFEAYYSLTINEHLAITPDIQVITNASGDDDFETVTVGAVRGQITF